jgi:hypothetical protein
MKSGKIMVTFTSAPDFAALHPGYGTYTALRMMHRNDQTMKNIVPKIDYIFSGDVQEYFIKDEVSGCWLVDSQVFATREEAQAYLDAHREEIIRRGPPVLDAEEAELYSKAIEHFERRLENGAIAAKEAHEIVTQLAKIEQRCPDELFRQRLDAVLGRLRAKEMRDAGES